jgi:hypothetical protein
VPCIRAASGSHVHYTAGKPLEIGTGIARDDAELLNRVLRHDNGNCVSGRELLQS